MTKRALVVIAVLILIPIIIVAVGVSRFKDKNSIVAEYGGSVDIIEYDGKTLRRVSGDEEYHFRFGKYLGKVESALTGASLYLVEDDETGSYYAIADGTRRILYTETGELTDGLRKEDSTVTRIVFDDYLAAETDAENIALLLEAGGKKVNVDMSEYKTFDFYDIYLSFDGSAILTECYGRLLYLAERENWLYISPQALQAAQEEYGEEISEAVYIADLITDTELDSLLDSYFFDNAGKEETEIGTA